MKEFFPFHKRRQENRFRVYWGEGTSPSSLILQKASSLSQGSEKGQAYQDVYAEERLHSPLVVEDDSVGLKHPLGVEDSLLNSPFGNVGVALFPSNPVFTSMRWKSQELTFDSYGWYSGPPSSLRRVDTNDNIQFLEGVSSRGYNADFNANVSGSAAGYIRSFLNERLRISNVQIKLVRRVELNVPYLGSVLVAANSRISGNVNVVTEVLWHDAADLTSFDVQSYQNFVRVSDRKNVPVDVYGLRAGNNYAFEKNTRGTSSTDRISVLTDYQFSKRRLTTTKTSYRGVSYRLPRKNPVEKIYKVHSLASSGTAPFEKIYFENVLLLDASMRGEFNGVKIDFNYQCTPLGVR